VENVEPAGFWIRAAGRMIDWIPNWIAGAIAGGVLAFTWGVLKAMNKPVSDWPDTAGNRKILLWIAGVIASWLYHSFSEAVAGATLGKRLLGLEVVSETLAPANLVQTLKRDLAYFVDAFFFGAVAYSHMKDSPEKQRIGDEWGKTRVVLRRSLPPESRRPTALFVCAFLAAVGLAAQTMLIAYMLLI
jgi:uncharacterized RDD family membrane protein YckC